MFIDTKARRWARKRNWFKARLCSASFINDITGILTREEAKELYDIRRKLKALISNWDENNEESKELYLKNGQ